MLTVSCHVNSFMACEKFYAMLTDLNGFQTVLFLTEFDKWESTSNMKNQIHILYNYLFIVPTKRRQVLNRVIQKQQVSFP